jgi:hypothetical protein
LFANWNFKWKFCSFLGYEQASQLNHEIVSRSSDSVHVLHPLNKSFRKLFEAGVRTVGTKWNARLKFTIQFEMQFSTRMHSCLPLLALSPIYLSTVNLFQHYLIADWLMTKSFWGRKGLGKHICK